MEELKQHQIYFLCQVLSDRFNQQQWNIIKRQPPETFLKRQEIILGKLLQEKLLFEKYFNRFYSNHVKLLNWSTLAIQNKSEICSYVFKNLMNKGSNFFNKKIKEIYGVKVKQKKTQKQGFSVKQMKQLEDQLYSQFFHLMVDKSKNQSHKRNFSKENIRKKQEQIMDGHDFYIRTFNACNGWKYIFYNYQKHMKGLSQKWKYNDKIRPNQQKNPFDPKNRNDLGLLKYEHEQKSKSKSQLKIFNLSAVVSNTEMNSIKNFKTIVKCSSNGKIYFRNHLGKPISYSVLRN